MQKLVLAEATAHFCLVVPALWLVSNGGDDNADRSAHPGNLHPREAHCFQRQTVLRSLKDRLRGKFNVAGELDGQDSWQRSVVGIVGLSNNAGHVEQSLRTVLEESERHLGRGLVSHELEVL